MSFIGSPNTLLEKFEQQCCGWHRLNNSLCPHYMDPYSILTKQPHKYLRKIYLRLSNASFVCCAAAVGGEKTAAIAPKAAWGSKDKGKRGERRTGEEKGVAIDAAKTKGGSEERSDASRTSRQDIENAGQNSSTIGVDAVAAELTQRARVPGRRASASLYFAFDHCFSVDGQGTIVTGTVLTGEVKVSFKSVKTVFVAC